jgi:hypothetical protein
VNALKRCAVVVTLLLASGCGHLGPATSPYSSTPSDGSAAPVVLDVTIFNGKVSPRGARLNLKVGERLTLSIRSDSDEEIHIHSEPEQEVPVKAGQQQRVTFTVDRPGKVAIEVHDLHAVVAELLIRP